MSDVVPVSTIVDLFSRDAHDFSDEPLLKPNPSRKSTLPIIFNDLWEMYKKAQGSFWTAEEIDFTGDPVDWKKMTQEEQDLVIMLLGFFAGADGIINDNLAENFLRDIDIPESKAFYGFQIAIENIHNETYSLMIDVLIEDRKLKDKLFNSLTEIPAISKLYVWVQKWIARTPKDEYMSNTVLQEMSDQKEAHRLAIIWCFAKRLIAFACVEGIMFSGPFAVFFWLKEKGILKGATFGNEKISNDEGLHCDYACLSFRKYIKNKPPAEQILNIVVESVEFEKEFMGTCLKRLLGLNIETMHKYIEFVADHLLTSIRFPKHWNAENPYPFMDKISFNGMTNFFERKVGEYSTAGFENLDDNNKENQVVGVLDDF